MYPSIYDILLTALFPYTTCELGFWMIQQFSLLLSESYSIHISLASNFINESINWIIQVDIYACMANCIRLKYNAHKMNSQAGFLLLKWTI